MDPFRTPPIGRGTAFTFVGAGPHLVHAAGDPIIFSSDLLPDTDNTLDLGSSAKRIAQIFVSNLKPGSGQFTASSAYTAGGAGTNWKFTTSVARTAGLLWDLQNNAGSKFSVGPLGQVKFDQYLEMNEMTAPSVSPANGARLYIDDTGGKTQLMVIFATGSAIQLAVEA